MIVILGSIMPLDEAWQRGGDDSTCQNMSNSIGGRFVSMIGTELVRDTFILLVCHG